MKKLLIIFAILAVPFHLVAQKIDSYVMWMPQNPMTDVKTIKIGNFENENPETWNMDVPKDIAESLTDLISTNERGGNIEYVYNPWMGTDVFQVLQPDEGDADLNITGKYTATQKEIREESDKIYHTNRSGTVPLPYVIKNYNYVNVVDYKVTVTLTKADGTVVETIESAASLKSNGGESIVRPPELNKLTSPGALVKSAAKSANWTVANHFVPAMVKQTYELEKVKNKDLKDKELRKTRKDADKAFKDANFHEAADLFRPMWENEQATSAAANLGMIYELLGNYIEAKKFYEEAGYQEGVKRIEQGLKNIELLKAWGKEIDQESGI